MHIPVPAGSIEAPKANNNQSKVTTSQKYGTKAAGRDIIKAPKLTEKQKYNATSLFSPL